MTTRKVWTIPQNDGSVKVVTRRATWSLLRVILVVLFAICLFQALFAGHFATAMWFFILLGLALPNYAKLRKLEKQAKGG
jgi:hypothetical protein